MEPRCLINFKDDNSTDLSISSSDSKSSDGSIPDLIYGSNADNNSDSEDENITGLLSRDDTDSNDDSDSDDNSVLSNEPILDSGERIEDNLLKFLRHRLKMYPLRCQLHQVRMVGSHFLKMVRPELSLLVRYSTILRRAKTKSKDLQLKQMWIQSSRMLLVLQISM